MRELVRQAVFGRSGIRVAPADAPTLKLVDLSLESPDGHTLIDPANASVNEGERVAITGPSGTGKTILLRAIVGSWPFGKGRIEVPGTPQQVVDRIGAYERPGADW